MGEDGVRTTAERLADVRRRLELDVDLWVASADDDGTAYLVPLSFLWASGRLLVSTASRSRTARNLLRGKRTRVALGDVRDVVMVDTGVILAGEAELRRRFGAGAGTDLGTAFAAKTGFDPRTLTTPYTWFWLLPHRIQAWREEEELAGRELMRDGMWVQP